MMKRALVAMLMAAAGSCWAYGGEPLKDPSAAVQVVNAQVRVTPAKDKCCTNVAVLGEFKNLTPTPVSELVVEAKMLDATGQTIDVLTQSVYGVVVMPGDQVAFKVSGNGASAPEAYAQVQARVTSGEAGEVEDVPNLRGEPVGWFQSWGEPLLISWGPMLLLIGVWVAVLRNGGGKKSQGNRTLALIEEQNALIARQAVALETLAASMPKTPPDSHS